MDYDDVIKRLRAETPAYDVRDGSTGQIKAIDFRLFSLERQTDSSNFVFRRFGVVYVSGLFRLPRLPKSDYDESTVKRQILSSIPGVFHSDVDIRLTPEIELDNDYHYPHVEHEGDIEDAFKITESLGENYNPRP